MTHSSFTNFIICIYYYLFVYIFVLDENVLDMERRAVAQTNEQHVVPSNINETEENEEGDESKQLSYFYYAK